METAAECWLRQQRQRQRQQRTRQDSVYRVWDRVMEEREIRLTSYDMHNGNHATPSQAHDATAGGRSDGLSLPQSAPGFAALPLNAYRATQLLELPAGIVSQGRGCDYLRVSMGVGVVRQVV
jgi:hypothetical protein